MSDDVIARSRAVLAEATPGPWTSERDRHINGYVDLCGADGEPIEEMFGDVCVYDEERDENDYPSEPDARAIVLAVNALPALLDVLEAAAEYRDYLERGELVPYGGDERRWRIFHRTDKALAALRAALDGSGE